MYVLMLLFMSKLQNDNFLKVSSYHVHLCIFVDQDQLPHKPGRDFLIQCPELSLSTQIPIC